MKKIKDQYALSDYFLNYCQRNHIDHGMAADALILSICAIIAGHSKDPSDRAEAVAIAAREIRYVLGLVEPEL